jgi:Mrp family chromosome partitioning ATPase
MSRNFELLHEAGKVQEMLRKPVEIRKPVEESRVVGTAPAAPLLPSTPAIQTEGPVREEILKLVQRLFLSGARDHHLVAFMGTEPGNGCSWICAHAAELLASKVGGTVCVVDCNAQSPTLHDEYKVQNHYGLADALLGDEPVRQYAQQLSRPNLWLLSCGSISQESQQLLTLETMRRRITELRDEFDYVLLDVAPLSAGEQGSILGKWCDGVTLVLKANSSSRKSARKAVELLQAAQIQVLGAVLNQRTFPIPESIYNRLG